MGLLYGRAGRLTAENGGFRPGQAEWAVRREDVARLRRGVDEHLSRIAHHISKCAELAAAESEEAGARFESALDQLLDTRSATDDCWRYCVRDAVLCRASS
jgi:hypothetical protein